jgi:hypothetical protein
VWQYLFRNEDETGDERVSGEAIWGTPPQTLEPTGGGLVGTHGFDRLEHHADGQYVIVCECGWHSEADASAEVVGNEWDEHRKLAGANNHW